MLKEKPWNNFDYSPKGAVQAVWCVNNHLYSSNSDFFNDLIFKINVTFFQKWCPDCCDEEPSFSLTK